MENPFRWIKKTILPEPYSRQGFDEREKDIKEQKRDFNQAEFTGDDHMRGLPAMRIREIENAEKELESYKRRGQEEAEKLNAKYDKLHPIQLVEDIEHGLGISSSKPGEGIYRGRTDSPSRVEKTAWKGFADQLRQEKEALRIAEEALERAEQEQKRVAAEKEKWAVRRKAARTVDKARVRVEDAKGRLRSSYMWADIHLREAKETFQEHAEETQELRETKLGFFYPTQEQVDRFHEFYGAHPNAQSILSILRLAFNVCQEDNEAFIKQQIEHLGLPMQRSHTLFRGLQDAITVLQPFVAIDIDFLNAYVNTPHSIRTFDELTSDETFSLSDDQKHFLEGKFRLKKISGVKPSKKVIRHIVREVFPHARFQEIFGNQPSTHDVITKLTELYNRTTVQKTLLRARPDPTTFVYIPTASSYEAARGDFQEALEALQPFVNLDLSFLTRYVDLLTNFRAMRDLEDEPGLNDGQKRFLRGYFDWKIQP